MSNPIDLFKQSYPIKTDISEVVSRFIVPKDLETISAGSFSIVGQRCENCGLMKCEGAKVLPEK